MPRMKNTNTTYTPPLAARGASWAPHLLIIVLVWSTWAVLMWYGDRWPLFTEYWFMSATMALGSFIAGATSEGGGAVAFPIMTLGFGAALYWINRDREREVCTCITAFGPGSAVLLFAVGIAGGIVSGLTGNGLDIVTFAVLVLIFSLNEKVATPTSVILMAANTVIGFTWRETMGGGVAMDAWNYWWVCVPVVVVGAPFGARFIRNRSRHFVAGFLYCSIIAQYAWALVVIPQSPQLLAFNVLVLAVATLFFWMLTRYGERRSALLRWQETSELE